MIKKIILQSKIGFTIYKILIFLRRFLNKKKKIKLNLISDYEIIGKKKHQTFTGYYDVNFISHDEKSMVYQRKTESNNVNVEIILYDFKTDKKHKILDKTKAWSWQLGSRLQWIDNNTIFYNSVNNKNILEGIILNLKTKQKRKIPYPLFSISKNNKMALILNFKILEQQRKGYGYNYNQKNKNKNEILVYDLINNKIIKKYNLKEINSDLSDDEFYFNHLSWSPNHSSFLVYVVRTQPRKTILYYFKNLYEFQKIDLIMQISHHEWISNTKIIFYGNINDKKQFYIFDFSNMKYKKIKHEYSLLDGHLNSVNKKNFIVDTYPDKYHNRHLYIYNIIEDKIQKLGEFFSCMDFKNDKKCDLHPTYSTKQRYILFDTSHNGYRQVVLVRNLKK